MRTALHFSLSSELTALFTAFLAGISTALLYRFFALLRRFFAAGKALTAVFDVLYVMAVLLLFFLYGFLFLGGDVRLYALTAAAAGFILWRQAEKIISKIIKKVLPF